MSFEAGNVGSLKSREEDTQTLYEVTGAEVEGIRCEVCDGGMEEKRNPTSAQLPSRNLPRQSHTIVRPIHSLTPTSSLSAFIALPPSCSLPISKCYHTYTQHIGVSECRLSLSFEILDQFL